MPNPAEIQLRLAHLLDVAKSDPGLLAEISRGVREFFGADTPTYAATGDEREAAAMRFAEWYLLERESDLLGTAPVARLQEQLAATDAGGEHEETDAMLGRTILGVFLIESAQDDLARARDLQGGERVEVAFLGSEVGPGDVMVGRLYEDDSGTYVPSTVLTLVRAAPELAVAFQRDLKQLAPERRLSQLEVEHLLFRRWGEQRLAESGNGSTPLERLEAELQEIFEDSAIEDELSATEVTTVLRRSLDGPGPVMGPLLERLAFDTDADLDRVRHLLLEMYNAVMTSAPGGERRGETDAKATTPKNNAPAPKPAEQRSNPQAGKGSLGERLAARIDEGLARHENMEEVFRDVDRILGESTDDEVERDDIGPSDGDLEPLILEFAWERGLKPPEEVELTSFLRTQREAPVPRLDVEYLESDDLLRYLLQTWLQAEPAKRLATVRASFGLLEDFLRWAESTQGFELDDTIRGAERFVVDAERLQRASLVLSTAEEPPAPGSQPSLLRIQALDEGAAEVLVGTEEREERLRMPRATDGKDLQPGDFIVAELARQDSGDVSVRGVAVVVPGDVEHLLG